MGGKENHLSKFKMVCFHRQNPMVKICYLELKKGGMNETTKEYCTVRKLERGNVLFHVERKMGRNAERNKDVTMHNHQTMPIIPLFDYINQRTHLPTYPLWNKSFPVYRNGNTPKKGEWVDRKCAKNTK